MPRLDKWVAKFCAREIVDHMVTDHQWMPVKSQDSLKVGFKIKSSAPKISTTDCVFGTRSIAASLLYNTAERTYGNSNTCGRNFVCPVHNKLCVCWTKNKETNKQKQSKGERVHKLHCNKK